MAENPEPEDRPVPGPEPAAVAEPVPEAGGSSGSAATAGAGNAREPAGGPVKPSPRPRSGADKPDEDEAKTSEQAANRSEPVNPDETASRDRDADTGQAATHREPAELSGSAPEVAGQLPNRRRVASAVLALLGVAAIAAGVLMLVWPDDPPPPPPPVPVAAPVEPVQLPAHNSAQPPGPPPQPPGTIRLPEGGTANLVRREVTSNLVLPIPPGLVEATWWGARLGDPKGAALLAGHVNWQGVKGPFDELWRVREGQNVVVIDAGGGQWVYRISSIVTLHKDHLPAHAPRLFGQDGPHRLVLVTCGGDYIGGTDGYRDNRIVTADLVSSP